MSLPIITAARINGSLFKYLEEEMGRRNARKLAFYLLYQYDFAEDAVGEIESRYDEIRDTFFEENAEEMNDDDRKYVLETTNGVLEHMAEIDSMLDSYAKGWTVERMSKVDKAILRLAAYEIKYSADVPDGVAVNEAVELAKTYSADEAPAFINGILGKVVESVGNN